MASSKYNRPGASGSRYEHPTHEPYTIGLYKIETDDLGHIIRVEKATKDDIVGLDIPAQDTTYSVFVPGIPDTSEAVNGLVPAPTLEMSDECMRYLTQYGEWDVIPAATAPTAEESGTPGLMSIADKAKLDKLNMAASSAAVELPVSAWSAKAPHTQTVNVAGATADNVLVVSPAPECFAAWCDSQIYASSQTMGALTFSAASIPSAVLKANVLCVNLGGGNV